MAVASSLCLGSACAEKIAYGTNYVLFSCSWSVTADFGIFLTKPPEGQFFIIFDANRRLRKTAPTPPASLRVTL
jgi:hypothetical protein